MIVYKFVLLYSHLEEPAALQFKTENFDRI